jgi:hypothetical protein
MFRNIASYARVVNCLTTVKAEAPYALLLPTDVDLPDPQCMQQPCQVEFAVLRTRSPAVTEQVVHAIGVELTADEVLSQQVLPILLVNQAGDNVDIYAARTQVLPETLADNALRPALVVLRVAWRRVFRRRDGLLEQV